MRKDIEKLCMGGAYSHVLSDRYRNFNKVFLMKNNRTDYENTE